jgi:hypothetical protein
MTFAPTSACNYEKAVPATCFHKEKRHRHRQNYKRSEDVRKVLRRTADYFQLNGDVATSVGSLWPMATFIAAGPTSNQHAKCKGNFRNCNGASPDDLRIFIARTLKDRRLKHTGKSVHANQKLSRRTIL